ncbi:lysylphosphatidylglycerol synthase transmembrane domain-containing protein [Jatrophihabitans sp. DSM 45814]
MENGPVEIGAARANATSTRREQLGELGQLEVLDTRPGRVRRSLDLVRALILLSAVLILAGLGTVAVETDQGANSDVNRLLSEVPHVFIRLFSVLGATAALAMPIALIVRELVRGQSRRLIEALLTGVVALGVVEGLDHLLSSAVFPALHDSLVRTNVSDTVRPLDAYLAALFAFVAIIGVAGRWQALFVATTALYVVSALTGTHSSLLSLIMSPTIGAAVGVSTRWLAGTVDDSPDAVSIATELVKRGLRLLRMERIGAQPADHRTYRCRTDTGRDVLVQAFDRDLIATGLIYRFYRLVRLRSDIALAPAVSLERITEHRSLLALAAGQAGAPVPALIAGVPCGPDTVVLVYDQPVSAALGEPSDEQLAEIWESVELLHHQRITHHGLIAEQVRLDPTGRVLLPIISEGFVFAGDLRISIGRVQLLITMAVLVGAERAVHSARTVLTQEELAATLPMMQTIALTRDARKIVARNKDILDELRAEIQQPASDAVAELAQLERVRPRTIVTLVAVIIAGYLLIAQFGSVDLAAVLSDAHWNWAVLVVLASALTYLAAAISLTGYVQEKLIFGRTVLAQLAASFVSLLTPPAVGGLAINLRYLRKAGISATGAATSVGLSQVVNAVSHVLLLIAFAAATGSSAHHSLPIPGWAFLALGAIAAVALLTLSVPVPRRWLLARILGPLREALPRLLNLVTSPMKLLESVGGAVALNGFYIFALWAATQALDAQLGFAQVAIVYLAGAAIGSVVPTPGGLGAVEVAMSTGLTAIGMSGTAAVSAVLLFRLATFVLPVPVGWLAMGWLQRRNAL